MPRLCLLLLLCAAASCKLFDDTDPPPSRPDAGNGQPETDAGIDGSVDGGRTDDDAGDGQPGDPAGNGGRAGGGRGGAAAGSGGASGRPAAGSGGSAGRGGAGGESTVDLSAALFSEDELPRIDIELSDEAQTALGDAPGTYVRATVSYGATTLRDVGLRIKGEASLRRLDQKAAFKLKLDEFVPKQELLGLRRLTFNNLVSDPSFIAERLAYRLFAAAGLPAPRCNSALVYVNGGYYGVYANVESEDKAFLRREFVDDSGNLYEDGQVDFVPGAEEVFDLETNETANDRSDLRSLISILETAGGDNYLADLEAVLDTDHFLRYAVLEATVNQWDGYAYTYFEPNNFRLYHHPARGQFVFLPWGLDMAWKPFPESSLEQIPLFVVPSYENRPASDPLSRDAGGMIWKKCLESNTCKARFGQTAREIITVYRELDLESIAAQYYEQIKDHVYEDTRKEVSNEDFEAAYQTVLSIVRTRATTLENDLTAAGL